MKARHLTAIVSCMALGLLSGCTTRYQDLLRDRDAQIREYNARIAQLRADQDELTRREQSARQRADELQQQLEGLTAPAVARDGVLQAIRRDLSDLDVRYNNRGRISIGIENTVTFDSGSTNLKTSAHDILRRVAALLQRDFPNRRIYVEGHTDTDPIVKTRSRFRSNRHLSAERADAVAGFLVNSCGIAEGRIAVAGFGPYDPRISGAVGDAKARNRRVEIVVGEPL